MKLYNQQFNIGKARYIVNFHDGIKKHEDGSNFYDMKIFRNKKDLIQFINKLESNGYAKS